jgi:hypothetical protein
MHERLRKIYELSLHGVGGEKRNAKELLDELLRRQRLTVRDLVAEERQKFRFGWTHEWEFTLLMQVIAKVTNQIELSSYVVRDDERARLYSLTPAQAVEVDFLYEEYRAAFAQEQERLLQAFVQRNEIFPAQQSERPERTAAELAEIERMFQMMEALERVPVGRKRLTAGAEAGG